MDINKIYANVRLVVPDATTIEMNKYILATLDEINAKGIETVRQYKVKHPPAGMESSMPEERKDGQGFNYYPDLKCLILPSEITLLSRVIRKDKTAIAVGGYTHLKGSFGIPGFDIPAYYLTQTGEMYFSVNLEDGEIITIIGSAGGLTVDVLPDKYLPYLSNSAIAGLSSQEYPNPDTYAIYSRKATQSKLATLESMTSAVNIKRNGRLY